jgi:hypothetical protein
LDIDPSSAVHNLTSSGGTTGFVAKYLKTTGLLDPLFTPRQFGGSATGDIARLTSLVLDTAGNLYVGGTSLGNVDLDPSSGIAAPPQGGFVLKLDAVGDYINHWEIATAPGWIAWTNVARVIGDTIYVVGSVGEGTTFFPNGESVTGFGGDDIYILALDQAIQ